MCGISCLQFFCCQATKSRSRYLYKTGTSPLLYAQIGQSVSMQTHWVACGRRNK